MSSSIYALRRRRVLQCTLAAALASAVPWTAAQAQQAWPTKPVKIIIPFGPGSATDIVARSVADELRGELGQTFIVENQPGANGFIAAQAAARAAPDGYTLFITSTTTTSTNQLLFKKLPYDPVKDFTPVGNIIEAYYMLAVPSSLPVKTVPELVSWLKANSKTASYGWGAAVSQIGGATFLKEVNVSAAGIPYKSSPQSVTDLIGGQLSFMVLDVTSGLAHVKNDRVRALMVSSKKRIPQLPNVPTAAEAGVPGFDAATFVGMLAPAGTPAPVVDKLSAALQKALRKPAMVERMDSCCSARLVPSSPSEFDEYLKKDRTSWANKITALGIQPE